MKKRNLLVLSMLAMSAMLAACNGATTPGGDTTSGGGGGGGGGGGDGKITVNFYIDYNAANANKEFNLNGGNKLEVWATQEVNNNSKVTKPADPTAPFPEFPVFLGWSYKEVVNSKEDLWNFDTDVIKSDTDTFSLYGVWVAQGEN